MISLRVVRTQYVIAQKLFECYQFSERGTECFCTSREVLDHSCSSCVEDDVSSVVEVVQIVTTVKASVSKDVVKCQLLNIHTQIHKKKIHSRSIPQKALQRFLQYKHYENVTGMFPKVSQGSYITDVRRMLEEGFPNLPHYKRYENVTGMFPMVLQTFLFYKD